jgi:hypothetical protein
MKTLHDFSTGEKMGKEAAFIIGAFVPAGARLGVIGVFIEPLCAGPRKFCRLFIDRSAECSDVSPALVFFLESVDEAILGGWAFVVCNDRGGCAGGDVHGR